MLARCLGCVDLGGEEEERREYLKRGGKGTRRTRSNVATRYKHDKNGLARLIAASESQQQQQTTKVSDISPV